MDILPSVANNSQADSNPLDSALAVGPLLNSSPGTPPLSVDFTGASNSLVPHQLYTSTDEASEGESGSVSDCDHSLKSSETSHISSTTVESSAEPTIPVNPFKQESSSAAGAWNLRKKYGESSEALDELMQYQGLEEVKQLFLNIKSRVDICKEQDPEGSMNLLKLERFNAVFQGNPGTGKTTVARLYAKFLYETGIIPSDAVQETSGMKIASEGVMNMISILENLRRGYGGGGVIFVDEAYQLTADYVGGSGRQSLDMMLVAMENNIGRLAAIFVGYKDEMEPFFEHNPGLESRIPYTVHFADFNDSELWQIFVDTIDRQYKGRMRVEGGLSGLYVRIAIRRLGQARGSRSFGNARAVHNLLARIKERQACRLSYEKEQQRNMKGRHQEPDCYLFTKEDLIGPNPSVAAKGCPALLKLSKLIGLEQVKKSVAHLIRMLEVNYQRELREESPLRFSLNQIFVGAPGTGKTTVAKLYGQILVHLGYLSRGDFVFKTPSEFIGECLGKSEAKTRRVLESTVGKVLVIDEAYMLDAGDSDKDQDRYKSGIIDTIVSMVHGAPGEDRCIILVGYEDKMRDMFQNVNPGLSRRFPVERPCRFENYNVDQLEKILRLKMSEEDLTSTGDAILAARDVFTRCLMRFNFANASEVDSILAVAKMNYEARLSSLPLKERLSAIALEDTDFDPEYKLKKSSSFSYSSALDGLVHKSIIERLVEYQNFYHKANKMTLNPRDFIPTNFVFKGQSGTGKTTTARQMGKIFYDMGFISTKLVVECSATDLIGQYVGQTAPKTKKKLQEALGRVLVIDEAHRLIDGSYAAEVVYELVQFLANPAYVGKIVVILTGLTTEMNKLMAQYPALPGLFADEITFESIPPDDCIKILLKEVESSRIGISLASLYDSSSKEYAKIRQLFRSLSVQPGWSNARDIKNLTNQVVRRFISSSDANASQQGTSVNYMIDCMEKLISKRREGVQSPIAERFPRQRPNTTAESTQQASPLAKTDTCTSESEGGCTAGSSIDIHANTPNRGSTSSKTPSKSNYAKIMSQMRFPEIGKEVQSQSVKDSHMREDGVSDKDWEKLSKAKEDKATRMNLQKLKIELLERQIESAKAREDEADVAKFWDRLTAEQKKKAEEEKIQKALQQMGRCVYGFAWVREGEGYRCEGGSHYVSDAQLAERM